MVLKSIAVGGDGALNAVDRSPIVRLQAPPQGIGQHLLRQRARKLRQLRDEERAHLSRRREALAVRQRPARIDRELARPYRATGRSRRSSPGRSPSGSMLRWQAAQVGLRRCTSSCSRIDFASVPADSSSAGTSAGGGAGGIPRRFCSTYLPRITGEVRVG